MKLFLAVTVVFYVTGSVACGVSFNYERIHNFGVGNRVIPGYRRQMFVKDNGYPESLPSSTFKYFPEPFSKISQGYRRNKDVKVMQKDFQYPPSTEGHKISCDSVFNCKITFISIDTDRGIPILLRGGAGYQHFTVVVRAKAGDPLTGTIKVYCMKKDDEDSSSGR